jgi:hypothetical protein
MLSFENDGEGDLAKLRGRLNPNKTEMMLPTNSSNKINYTYLGPSWSWSYGSWIVARQNIFFEFQCQSKLVLVPCFHLQHLLFTNLFLSQINWLLQICMAVGGLWYKINYTYLGPSWSWSYGSWIYNYLCNQCLSLH